MANVKFTDLTAATSIISTDLVITVTDPGGTPLAQKITLANFKTSLGLSGTNTGDQTITLTGDVTGAGTGSFAATIANSAVTTAKINDGAVTEAKQTLADNTTNDVSTTKHGYVPKAPNSTSVFLRGDATWGTPASADVSCRAYQNAAQSITTSWVVLNFNLENYDTSTFHDNSTNPSRFTVPSTGKYQFFGQIRINANAAKGLRVRLNGSTILAAATGANAGNPEFAQVFGEYSLTAGDYVEFMGWAGATQNNSGDADTWAVIRQVSF